MQALEVISVDNSHLQKRQEEQHFKRQEPVSQSLGAGGLCQIDNAEVKTRKDRQHDVAVPYLAEQFL